MTPTSIPQNFVPNNFSAPLSLDSPSFHFTVLNEAVAELDHQTVMANRTKLVGIFGPNDNWPSDNLTLDENRKSLRIHQYEFDNKIAFAYSILNSEKYKCLGSVYIDASRCIDYDCEVYFWLAAEVSILEDELFSTLKKWLVNDWPFTRLAFPGRTIDWQSWQQAITRSK